MRRSANGGGRKAAAVGVEVSDVRDGRWCPRDPTIARFASSVSDARLGQAGPSIITTMQGLLVLASCAFASSFSLRLFDPLVLPVALQFAITPEMAALLGPAYALPYAVSQPFLGPIGDRFGRMRCMRVCVAGLAAVLLLGALAPSFGWLLASRVAAGIFGGGLVPLVLASLGDQYDMTRRQVAIGRMLVAIIGGQMLGSVVAGLASSAWGWRSALLIAMTLALCASLLAWTRPTRESGQRSPDRASFRTLYQRVFDNPKAPWLLACVFAEGVLFFGFFPHMGSALLARSPALPDQIAVQAGLVLGAFGLGGLLYAATVRRLLGALGVRRLCVIGAVLAVAGHIALAAFGPWWQAALAMFAIGLAFYMVHNSLQTEATELAPSARGSAVALFAAALFLGQGIGPLLVGAMLPVLGLGVSFLSIAGAVALLGWVVVRRVVGSPRESDPQTLV